MSFEFFRFIKHARERTERRLALEAQERADERAHQRAMLETIFTKLADSQKGSNESIIALADAQRAQAAVMQTWLDGFKISDPSPAPPVVVRDDEEWLREQLRLNELGLADLSIDSLPPEFQLAYELTRQSAAASASTPEDFDREDSSF